MTPNFESFPAVVVASTIAAGVTGAAVRYGIIEYKAANTFCATAAVSWPCEVRTLVIASLMNTPALGLLAVVLGLIALFGDRRAVALAAAITGALGLMLYNAELGACGLLLGAIRTVRT